jgi:hypothetical protein
MATKKTEQDSPKLNLDGQEYEISKLPQKAQVAVQFLRRVEQELANLRYEVDKCALARAKAVEDLKTMVSESESAEQTKESIQ